MKRTWDFLGIVCYWLTWPGVALFLRNSTRTRIIVNCGDEILLVKTWLGSGKWGLPGGGLHRHEDPTQGAVRELQEETGIVAKTESLEYLSSHVQHKRGVQYTLVVYALRLSKKPEIRRQRLEINDATWRSWRAIYQSEKTEPYIKAFLEQCFMGEDGT
jgi:8-oxo-dGTP pyrophosphatase MutT (NUDIX family)